MAKKKETNQLNHHKDGLTGNNCLVDISGENGTKISSVRILKQSKDSDTNIQQTAYTYRNASLATAMSQLHTWLGSVALCKTNRGSYLIDEYFVPELYQLIEEANEAIRQESEAFVAHYDEHKEAFRQNILQTCVANKRKTHASKIIKDAMCRFPSKDYVLGAKVVGYVDTYLNNYASLSSETKQLVDETTAREVSINRTKNLANRVMPVVKSLALMLYQWSEKAKIHGHTVNAYNSAIENLRVANEIEFATPLPNIAFFCKEAACVLADPEKCIQPSLVGLLHFSYEQGLIDYLPYEVLEGACIDRDAIEEIGEDPNNNVRLLLEGICNADADDATSLAMANNA